MNTDSLVMKGLRFRPQRAAFLLLGFAVGVMVMVVLLSVGSAVLKQAQDVDLTGGGDIVLLPVGIDVSVLKTGGVTALDFDIPNARFLTREILSLRRLGRDVATVSPELTRAYATLRHGGREQLVRVDGVVPSRFRGLYSALSAAFRNGPGERDYIDPDFTALLYKIDAFHPPVVDSTQTWAEWHYFNYHDAAGRSLYVSISALAWAGDLAPGGYSRGSVLFEFVDENGRRTKLFDALPGREVATSFDAPDLLVGLNSVRLEHGVYHVDVALADSLGRPVSASLDLKPQPHQYIPPLTPLGADAPFGYVVPVVRGHMTGTVTMAGRTIALDGIGYHDHNWGHFRDAVWDWGIVHAGPYSILYGRFARSLDALANQPVLVALFDSKGARPFVLTSDYSVTWEPAGAVTPSRPPKTRTTYGAPETGQPVPHSLHLEFVSGLDSLRLAIDVGRRFVTETGGGKQPLFRAGESGKTLFFQLEGKAHLSGRLDGAGVDRDGHAYAETFRVRRP